MNFKDIISKNDTNYDNLTLKGHIKELLYPYFDQKHSNWNVDDFNKLSYDLKRKLKIKPSYKDPSVLEHTNALISQVITPNHARMDNVLQLTNIFKEFEVLSNLGRDIPHIEKLSIQRAIKTIAKCGKIETITFFGKIFTKSGFYAILYGHRKDSNQKDLNYLDIYVSVDYLKWTKLDEIKPSHVRMSRKIKRILSGDLNSMISDDFTEAQYMKAIILRIIHSNSIIPAGMYMLDENDEKSVSIDQEFIWDNEKYLNIENWVYRYPEILKSGDITHDRYGEELREELDSKDPTSVRLRNIADVSEGMWVSRLSGEPFTVNKKENGELTTFQLTKLAIFNNKWPGALNYFDEESKRFGMIYFGFGLRRDQIILPLNVEEIENEPKFKDNREYKEPNPDNDDDVLETDSEPEEEED